jgi:hypothetical protein
MLGYFLLNAATIFGTSFSELAVYQVTEPSFSAAATRSWSDWPEDAAVLLTLPAVGLAELPDEPLEEAVVPPAAAFDEFELPPELHAAAVIATAAATTTAAMGNLRYLPTIVVPLRAQLAKRRRPIHVGTSLRHPTINNVDSIMA